MHFTMSPVALVVALGATLSMASPIAPAVKDAAGPPLALTLENDIVARSTVASQSPTYQDTIIQHHNVHRANHSAPNLVWNQTLASYAQAKANTCKFDHSQAPGLNITTGQNIAMGTWLGPSNVSVAITNLFYNNEFNNYAKISKNFSINNPSTNDASNPFEGWGHMTQLVWTNTKSVACGTSACTNGLGYFTACLYYPPGNYLGNFQNVKKPAGYPTVKGTYTNN